MILICFFWFSFLYYFVYKISKSKDVLSPTRFVALKYAFFNLPFILMVYIDPDFFPKEILTVTNTDLSDAFFKYTLVQTIAFISLIIGIRTYKNRDIIKIYSLKESYRILKNTGLIFFALGLFIYYNFLKNVGGVVFLLENLIIRQEITEGQSTSAFLPLFILSSLFLLSCIGIKNKKSDMFLFVLFFVISIFVFSSLGGRKATLFLIITMVFGYHFLIKKIELKKMKKSRIILISSFITFYIFFIPIIRSKDGFDKIKETNIIEALEIEELIFTISYTYIDVFAANYFNTDNAWYMKSVGDIPLILTSTGEKKINLPPIDDGLYFWSIVRYKKHFEPPVARRKLYSSSWPIENFGFAYANLLIPGIIIFFFLQGRIFAFAYNLLKLNSKSSLLIFLYMFILFNFNFSNLRIVQFLTTLPIIGVCYFLFYMFKKNINKL